MHSGQLQMHFVHLQMQFVHLAMRFGSRLIKPLLILMSLALTAKMLIDPKNPIHLYLFG